MNYADVMLILQNIIFVLFTYLDIKINIFGQMILISL